MAYLSLYRKWRPQTFEDMVGQRHVVRTLKNAIRTGRIAHAYLFAGPRGTGKTSTAKLLAKAVNCAQGPTEEPCDKCPSCVSIREGRSLDVIEIDAASNRGIDEIRDLREKVKYAPSEGRYKVYIIDEVHMLTTEAFNALLKTLEEPPSHVIFVLATTEPYRIPATILSRCQRFDFRLFTMEDLVDHLKRVSESVGVEVQDEAITIVARYAQGSMRDALSLLDQCLSFGGQTITAKDVVEILGVAGEESLTRFSELVLARDTQGLLRFVAQLSSSGMDLRQFLADSVEHFRNLLVVKETGSLEFVDATQSYKQGLAGSAARFQTLDLIRIIDVLSAAEADVKRSSMPRLVMEVAVVKLAELTSDDTPLGIAQRVRDVEGLVRRVARFAAPGQAEAEQDEVRHSNDGTPGADGTAAARDEKGPAGRSAAPAAEEPDRGTPHGAGGEILGSIEPAGPLEEASGEVALRASTEELSSPGPSREEIEELWHRLLEAVRQERKLFHAVLQAGSLVSFDGTTAVVGFPKGYKFHYTKASEPANLSLVQSILTKLWGPPVTVRVVCGDAEDDRASVSGPQSRSGPSQVGSGQEATSERPQPRGGEPEPSSLSQHGKPQPPKGAPEVGPGGASKGQAPDGEEPGDPLVKAVLDIFGGKVIKVDV